MPHSDPVVRARYKKDWDSRNLDKKRAYGRATYQRRKTTHIEKCRTRFMLSAYGVTREKYEEMLERQGGLCGVCKKAQKSGRKLAIDHDHDTGKVRGLLCQVCNARLEKFLDYIREAEAA